MQEHPTTHYIWRTRGDNKVRAAHAANNGKLFAWDNPPPTRHPGEDFGCRCTAEPYVRGESEFAYQTLTSPVNDSKPEWETFDVSEKNGVMKIDGTVEYFFDDDYTDPVGLRQGYYGTSDPAMVAAIVRYITDGGGGAYAITGQWQTALRAEAKLNESDSRYKKPDEK